MKSSKEIPQNIRNDHVQFNYATFDKMTEIQCDEF